MTWIKGTSTWGDLATDLTKLICGEMPDGVGATVAAGDRWVREVTRTVTDAVLNSTTTLTSATAAFTAADVGAWVIATGVPNSTAIASVTNATTVVLSKAATASASGVSAVICLDGIRTPASKDVATGLCANRTGYFSALGIVNVNSPMSTASSSVCRVTSPFTTEASVATNHRWMIAITVTTANTVAGNYSTLVASVTALAADSGGGSSGAGTGSFNAGGVSTALINGLVVTVSDPSGIIPVGTTFLRAFSATYMYGIDSWPMLYRTAGATSFGTPPPGVAGTDYDVVIGTNSGSNTGFADRGGLFSGLGIKTATGLGVPGALYTVSENMALIKCRIFNSATAGVLSLDTGAARTDVQLPGTIRSVAGPRVLNWCHPFLTPGSVTTTAAVQYWLSVKNDGIVLVLNGDTGFSGKLATAFVAAVTPVEPVYDVFPVIFSQYAMDYTVDQSADNTAWIQGVQYSYWALRRRQDGSEGTRDWQTRWMRGEGFFYAATSGGPVTDVTTTGDVSTTFTSTATYGLQVPGGNSNATQLAWPTRQVKPTIDGKWWLYGYTWVEGYWAVPNQTAVLEARFIRFSTTRFFYIPGDQWGSGDELTDSGTGAKYLLVSPDFPGIGCRFRLAANSYAGGLAVLEV